MIEMGMTMDYGQLVMDNEFAEMIKFLLKGVPVNDETLAVDTLLKVGSFGHFLNQKHTLKHMQTAQTHPVLLDRQRRERWKKMGGKDIYQKAWEKAERILETHQPEPLAENVAANIRSIVVETEKELGLV